MKLDKEAIGLRISSIRKKQGLTLEEFGKRVLDAGKSNVSKWERGLTIPSNERIKKIAEMGDVTTDYLIHGDLTDFLFRNFTDFLPENEKALSKMFPGYLLIEFANELKKEKVNISDVEKIKSKITEKIPYFKSMSEKSIDPFIRYISMHREYKEQVKEYLAAEAIPEEFRNSTKIDEIFDNSEKFIFKEKAENSRLIEGIHDALQTIVEQEIYYVDITAPSMKLSDFLLVSNKINWKSENFNHGNSFYVRRTFKPFPSKYDYKNLMIDINFAHICKQFVGNPSVLIYFFEEMNLKVLNDYFVNTQIIIVFEGNMYIGFIDSNLIFESDTTEGLFKLKVDANFDFNNIFPVAGVYY